LSTGAWLKKKEQGQPGLDEGLPFSYFSPMSNHLAIMAFFLATVTLQAEPSKDVKSFEAATDTMSKEEVRAYMGRGPDEALTPHLWRYRGSWTNSETLETFNTVDLAFGMLTNSHKYGVMRYTWDNTTPNSDTLP
jgi:hypothetical protein